MSVAFGVLMAAVLAATPEVRDDHVAAANAEAGTPVASASQPGVLVAFQSSHVPRDTILQALPPAPELVTRASYFGTITLDHRAHLARRITCKACHDPGRVGKIEFTPRVAHERCVGCHRAESRGPTSCKECHVKPVEPVETPAVMTAKAEPEKAPETPAAAPPSSAAAAPAGGATDGSNASVAAARQSTSQEDRRYALRQMLEVGYATGQAVGPAFRLSSRQEGITFEQSVDRLSRDGGMRTVVLLGGGIVRPFGDRLDLVAVGLAGVDAVQEPGTGIMPAVGARVGLEWLPRRWFLGSVHLSMTGVVDVARRQAMGREIGATTVYATLATGFRLNRP